MSRRPPNANVERAAANQQTLKTLVKLESNKSCADCKKNKHPRWASWNLGIFLCIRCSGIHRGMGTHISRVKSVDLDAWTDEQMQNMLRWGNARANKYWEAKLAVGHVPADGKIENFIRTKYDSKRWVMDGGMPDPSTLDADADDEVPLSVVQEKARLGQRSHNPSTNTPPPQIQKSNPDIDLFGDSVGPPPGPKSNSNIMSSSNPPPTPPKTDSAPTRLAKTGESSLLGFDFFGEAPASVPARPSSSASSITSTNASSRPDLKQSILSLYASTPRTASPSQQPQPGNMTQAQSPPPQGGFGNLESDFSSLSFGPPPSTSRPSSTQQSSAFAAPPAPKASAIPQQKFGGSFFDSKPSNTTTSTSGTPGSVAPPTIQRGSSFSSGFGDFEAATSTGFNGASQSKSNALANMFDFSGPSPVSEKPSTTTTSSSNVQHSPFNISSPATQAPLPRSEPKPAPMISSASLMNMDPWGSSEAWSSSSTSNTAMPAAPPPKATATMASSGDEWGWSGAAGGESSTSGGFGSSSGRATQITADEDFGGWASSTVASPSQQSKSAEFPRPTQTTQAPAPAPPPKPAGGFNTASDDLFSNVWE